MTEKEKLLLGIKEGKTKLEGRALLVLDFDDLLKTDDDGITYLEYACRNKEKFSGYDIIGRHIVNNLNALYICAKANYFDWIVVIPNEDLFFEKLPNGYNLIDYIVKNHVKVSWMFYMNFQSNVEIVDYIVKYSKQSIGSISESIATKLFEKNDGKYLIDKYIDIPEIQILACKKVKLSLLFSYCQEKNNYELLKYCSENELTKMLTSGVYIFDFLLDKGIEPVLLSSFDSERIFNSLLKRERYDLLYKANLSLLLREYKDGKTYFDLLIEKTKQGQDMHLEKVFYNSFKYPDETAKAIIKLAQNDMQGYIPQIDYKFLLSRDTNSRVPLIKKLFELDREVTISKIIPPCRDRQNPDFALLLKLLGIEDVDIYIENLDESYTDKFINKCSLEYAKDSVSICPDLISELKDLFYNDKKSDKGIIDCLISSYTYLTSLNNPNKELFRLELEKLILVKKNNYEKFVYVKDKSSHCDEESVHINEFNISTINHETSHALHDYLASGYVPDNFDNAINNARNNPNLIKKVNAYHKIYLDTFKKIKEMVSIDSINEYYESLYEGDKKKALDEFLSYSKEKKKQQFSGRGYDDSVLDIVLDGTYTADEFIKQKIKEEQDRMVTAIFRNYYDALIAISDIIDSVFGGKFYNGILINDNNEKLDGKHFGHGIYYYNILPFRFKEMIADYGQIIKSKNSSGMVQYLRCVVGDEIVDMIKDVYENRTLGSNMYVNTNKMEDVSNAR